MNSTTLNSTATSPDGQSLSGHSNGVKPERTTRIDLRSLSGTSLENVEDPAVQALAEHATAQEILTWAIDHWGDKLALVTSFQAGGMALLDMAWKINPKIRVLTLDTGRLPQETYRYIDRIRERYDLEIEMFFPDMRLVQQMVRESGPELFYQSIENRQRCCYVRKVEPLQRALTGSQAWITGLRRDQNANRASTLKIDRDPKQAGRFKLSPLADWTEERVQDYLRENNVPIHPLYDRGYTSIGCAPCTRATRQGEDPRAGRWWWEAGGKSECGLHLTSSSSASSQGQTVQSSSPLSVIQNGPSHLVPLTRKAS